MAGVTDAHRWDACRMIDYHLHGNFCGHGTGELEEYIQEALKKGFVEIGFSAHLPKVVNPDPYHAMLEEDLPRYVALVERLRDSYRGDISIKLGIEADHFIGYENETRRLIEAYPFDYVFGSVHFLGDWHFTSRVGRGRYKEENPDEAFPRYFTLIKEMIKTGIFDILAHPDAIRRAQFKPHLPMDAEYGEVARLLRAYGMAIEVNTAGIRRGAGSVYPDEHLLRICVAEEIPVTLGSDAHTPGDVGSNYEEAFQMLSSMGVTEIATYEKRRISKRPISDFLGCGRTPRS